VIRITGTVQGVGFRPFVYRSAVKHDLLGYVTNLEDATVEVTVEGEEKNIKQLIKTLKNEAPPVASIQSIQTSWQPYEKRFKKFEIKKSQKKRFFFGFMIPPDIGICPECVEDILSPEKRRWNHYPFTCCAHCGPRFTAIYESPYDRVRTNMCDFPLCEKCHHEYEDPTNRRFHAQGICCPNCGPQITLYTPDSKKVRTDRPLQEAAKLLDEGYIVAIKGIGGIHIAAKTTDDHILETIRKRRRRPNQPFAIMSPGIDTIKTYAVISQEEEKLLTSWQKPIVLLRKSPNYYLSELVSPGLDTIGVMLPYTGIHLLLYQFVKEPALVMTSGNDPGLPMAITHEEAFKTLGRIVDYLLLHNREIVNRCDDSVLRVINGTPTFIRRSRGYVPSPIKIPVPNDEITALAVGAELRNTGAIIYKGNCYLTQHIGDTENLETLNHLEQSLRQLSNLLGTKGDVDVITCDLHPRYITSRLAQETSQKKSIPLVQVQHHHAHITSVMAENMVPPDQPVIGISMDGIGYGPDGAVWGGEILEATYQSYVRRGHLQLQPMPGGDLCTYYPVRMLISILSSALSEQEIRDITRSHVKKGLPHRQKEFSAIFKQLKSSTTPKTTSSGRLLDAIAAAMGICYERTYEGEPAMRLEVAANWGDPSKIRLKPEILHIDSNYVLDTSQLIHSIMTSKHHRIVDICAAAQRAFAMGMAEMAVRAANDQGIRVIAISGGVAVNLKITREIEDYVRSHKLHSIRHRMVPPGDGGISLGQAISGVFNVTS